MNESNWNSRLQVDDRFELRPGVTPGEVTKVEALLNAVFPDELRELYLVADGVLDKDGQWFVIWPLAEVVMRNQQSWEWEGEVRERFVGFGDDGTGDPFCVPRDGGSGVFHWSSVDGAATRLAESIAIFWSGWVSGDITT